MTTIKVCIVGVCCFSKNTSIQRPKSEKKDDRAGCASSRRAAVLRPRASTTVQALRDGMSYPRPGRWWAVGQSRPHRAICQAMLNQDCCCCRWVDGSVVGPVPASARARALDCAILPLRQHPSGGRGAGGQICRSTSVSLPGTGGFAA